MVYDICFDLRYAPQDMTDEEKVEMARQCTGQDLAMMLMQKSEFWVDHENNCVRGTIRTGPEQHG